MRPTSKIVWKIYVGVFSAATTIAAQKLLTLAWKTSTGKEPPSPTDPETPLRDAVIWAVASGLGLGVTQFVVTRFAASRWAKDMGTKAPDIPQIKFKV